MGHTTSDTSKFTMDGQIVTVTHVSQSDHFTRYALADGRKVTQGKHCGTLRLLSKRGLMERYLRKFEII